MSNWTKLSKHCYVGRIGPSSYRVYKLDGRNDWFLSHMIMGLISTHSTAQQAMLAAEEMK